MYTHAVRTSASHRRYTRTFVEFPVLLAIIKPHTTQMKQRIISTSWHQTWWLKLIEWNVAKKEILLLWHELKIRTHSLLILLHTAHSWHSACACKSQAQSILLTSDNCLFVCLLIIHESSSPIKHFRFSVNISKQCNFKWMKFVMKFANLTIGMKIINMPATKQLNLEY